ncbi:MAG TPA: hypothetical protein VHM88_20420 [Candidatus Acidoferrales bacterium]|nr:hypothetical protein [Candidatus Acidoferrales bacterium]
MRGERFGQALAVLQARTRHRHQELHGDVRGDPAAADSLLHAFGKQFHQRQSARHPTLTAIKAACQLLEAVAETLLEFHQ